jgi:hypothetical protein
MVSAKLSIKYAKDVTRKNEALKALGGTGPLTVAEHLVAGLVSEVLTPDVATGE